MNHNQYSSFFINQYFCKRLKIFSTVKFSLMINKQGSETMYLKTISLARFFNPVLIDIIWVSKEGSGTTFLPVRAEFYFSSIKCIKVQKL